MSTTDIYFVQQFDNEKHGPIKIGKANNWKSRLSSHRTSNPNSIEVVLLLKNCRPKLEKELHELFNGYRISGEWFNGAILNNIGWLVRKIKSVAIEHGGEKTDDWMIWFPKKNGEQDLAKKISLYSLNAERRKSNSSRQTNRIPLEKTFHVPVKRIEVAYNQIDFKESFHKAWGKPEEEDSCA